MKTATLILMCSAVLGADRAGDYLQKPADWFRSDEARAITRNILSWQAKTGSWPKNTDTTKPFSGDVEKSSGTFDNSATTGELRFLALAIEEPGAKVAFDKGLNHILEAQYPNGGWPQFFPAGNGYHRHITFNDGSMVRLMNFLREVATQPTYAFVDAGRRQKSQTAFDRGVDCILKTQIRVNDRLTVWCAQHDAVTLEPRPARAYELISLSGSESVGILDLLMSLEKPTPKIIQAVDAGVAWFETAKIVGLRQTRVDGDKKIIPDPSASPLWARFYEIETNRPFFCGRDGVKKYSLAEIESERRNGYAWYGDWAKDLPARHAAWKKRIGN